MSPSRTGIQPVTPTSVKILMLVQAGIISYLAYWLYNEYNYNIYFQQYLNITILSHVTTYTAVLGLGIGLAGSAIAATLYRNLQHAKYHLETITGPKIKGTVEKILSSIPSIDDPLPGMQKETMATASATPGTLPQTPSSATAIVPMPVDEKKQSETPRDFLPVPWPSPTTTTAPAYSTREEHPHPPGPAHHLDPDHQHEENPYPPNETLCQPSSPVESSTAPCRQ